jgi:CheY-like chemotaxis protein
MSHMGREHLVLVVDDDPDVREAIAEVVGESGYRTLSAANGREAMAQLQAAQSPPCVILLDIMMPIMDGWEFRAEQSRDPRFGDIPVVVLTAHANMEEVVRRMHAVDCLEKPFDLSILLATLERFCGGESSHA